MGSKRVFAISSQRRGFGRVAVVVVALAIAVAGCGEEAATDSEKAADVEVLNGVLAQELTMVDAYGRALEHVRGRALVLAGQLRGQNQAHLDAIIRSIRGAGGETDAEAAELEPPGPKSAEEALLLAYEEENTSLGEALDAAADLNVPSSRTLAAALAASHAQHLAVLRQLLGESVSAAVPEAFEAGDAPAPASPGEKG
jgi:hypothetical protein